MLLLIFFPAKITVIFLNFVYTLVWKSSRLDRNLLDFLFPHVMHVLLLLRLDFCQRFTHKRCNGTETLWCNSTSRKVTQSRLLGRGAQARECKKSTLRLISPLLIPSHKKYLAYSKWCWKCNNLILFGASSKTTIDFAWMWKRWDRHFWKLKRMMFPKRVKAQIW